MLKTAIKIFKEGEYKLSVLEEEVNKFLRKLNDGDVCDIKICEGYNNDLVIVIRYVYNIPDKKANVIRMEDYSLKNTG